MAEADGAPPSRPPTIALPPRSSFESLFTGGGGGFAAPGFSPGPMTLVSNFFSEQQNTPDAEFRSFSQLLAGAMTSPGAQIPKSEELGSEDKGNLGFKQNRPMSLVVQSPMFMIPSGLSPSGLLNSPGFFSPGPSPFGMSHQQALAHVTAQAALAQSFQTMHAEYQRDLLPPSTESPEQQQEISALMSDQEGSRMESPEVSYSDKKSLPSSLPVDKPANDGYNWRKYGQKQVKASEYPRSYYKCTHINCPARKKVGRSLDGVISDIIYKGQHNHKPPQPNKRAKGSSTDMRENRNSQAKAEHGIQSQTQASRPNEVLSSQPVLGNIQSSTELIVLEETDDRVRQDEEAGDEPNPKRRNTEVGASELTSSYKAVTESKIVVQTRSEVDLLDDGYKWRKYGQKVVKGNPHPRSYYKCTSMGCNVRKHVERASTDPKSVVTTYEGKHNHDIPQARGRIHTLPNSSGLQAKAQKGAVHKETNFGKDQRSVFLQLKEEQIIA